MLSTVNASNSLVYRVGRFEIFLPHGHNLPVFQHRHPQYDRFLPHLAKYLPAHAYVIDIGANCADTLAGMLDGNPFLNFLCVEADDSFYDYLLFNLALIKAALPDCCVKTLKCLAGSEVANIILVGEGGTKKAILCQDQSSHYSHSQSVDCILEKCNVPQSAVSLLKVDVDGYDYDVVNSADSLINNKLPILFFECDYDDAAKKNKFKNLVDGLGSKGYSEWAVFDNYGALMLKSCGRSDVLDLIEYVWRQKEGKSQRTMYYIDVLATSPADAELIYRALDSY